MKRIGNLYDKLYTREVMEEAFKGMMKDKKGKGDPTTQAFMIKNNKEYYMAEAARILYERVFKPRKPRDAYRLDANNNKLRHIQAPAMFPDQIVHWALMVVLRDIFMKGMDHWCCASVKDRGGLYAKNFIEEQLDPSLNHKRHVSVERMHKYHLKMDIRKFFENIDRDILMEKLEKKIKDKEILDLCRKIIYSVPGTGLPLGYYTSQWFANFYLQDFDHYLREVLMPKYGVKVYVRYMDDMIILGGNKRKLKYLMNDINTYLHSISLELKATSAVYETEEHPIDFIGYRFSFGKTVLRKETLHRARRANNELYKGKFTLKKLRSVSAYTGIMSHTDTQNYEEEYFEGTRNLEHYKLKEFLAKDRESYINSPEYKHLIRVENDIETLRENEINERGIPLIRYYKNQDEVRVVARAKFEYPDEEEYWKKVEISKEAYKEEQRRRSAAENAKKPKKSKKKKQYYPTAEISFSDRSKIDIIRDYNYDIQQAELLMVNN